MALLSFKPGADKSALDAHQPAGGLMLAAAGVDLTLDLGKLWRGALDAAGKPPCDDAGDSAAQVHLRSLR